jgi:hypothetical protein
MHRENAVFLDESAGLGSAAGATVLRPVVCYKDLESVITNYQPAVRRMTTGAVASSKYSCFIRLVLYDADVMNLRQHA